jgi:hypothetical protein
MCVTAARIDVIAGKMSVSAKEIGVTMEGRFPHSHDPEQAHVAAKMRI